MVSLWLSSFDALPPASPSPLHHPSCPSQSPLYGRVFSHVLSFYPSNFLSLSFSLAYVHFFLLSLPVSSVFRVRSTLPAVLRARTSLSAYLILSPFPPPSPHPLSSSSAYLLHLLRLSSFSFLVQLAILRSRETDWKLSFSHTFPPCVPPSPCLRPI